MQAPIHQSKSDVFSNVTASPARPIVQFQQENQEPSTPTSIKRKQVLINEKNTSILQRWDQKLRLSNDRMEVSILSSFVFVQKKTKSRTNLFRFEAFTLNEMANVKRLRNVEEKITEATNIFADQFKEKVQSILEENQLLISSTIARRETNRNRRRFFFFFSFFVHSANSSNFGAVDALQRRSTDDERRFLRRNERKNDERNQNEFSFHSFRTLFFFPLWRRNVTSSTTSPLKNTLRPSNFFVRAI